MPSTMTREEFEDGRRRRDNALFWLYIGMTLAAIGASFAMLPQ